MKSKTRLIGLFFLSLFLAACWLSTLQGVEDPWDENKATHPDSSTTLNDDGVIGDDGPTIIVITDGPGLFKNLPFRVFLISGFDGVGVKGGVRQFAPAVRMGKPLQATDGEYQKTEK